MRAVNYYRYSSHNQDEFSIEGQQAECMKFIEKNNHTLVGEYADRAKSGTKDDREAFLRMIDEAEKGLFDCIIVYKLDRFARNRYDSAIYKKKLEKYGVRVLSATEYIADGPLGALTEGLLEGMAEYFSLNLGENVKRGMGINAENCYYNGGTVPVGFALETIKIPNPKNPNHPIIKKRYIHDTDKAPYMLKAYEMYAERTTMVNIIKYLKKFGIKTATGQEFNRNSLRRIFTNKKYKGVYSYNGVDTPDGIPRIVSDELFQRVQDELARNGLAPGRNRAKTEYLLTTKLFCGECKSKMTGKSGTSGSGKLHTYYKCVSADNNKVNLCNNKTNLRRDEIENLVTLAAQRFINSENIDAVATEIAKISKTEQDDSQIRFLEKNLRDAEKRKERALNALLECDNDEVVRKALMEEISKTEGLKFQYQQELLVQKSKREVISARELKYFFKKLGKGNIEDWKYKKMLVNTLINRVYLYPDKVLIIINIGSAEKEIEISLLEKSDDCSSVGLLGLPICNLTP